MRRFTTRFGLLGLVTIGSLALAESPRSVIVQGPSAAAASSAVLSVGGRVISALPIIDAVGAELDARQRSELARRSSLRLHENRGLETSAAKSKANTTTPATTTPTADQMQDFAQKLVDATDPYRTYTDGAGVFADPLFVPSYAEMVNATSLHAAGITGKGVTIAILDTGLWTAGRDKFVGRVLADVTFAGNSSGAASGDPSGHGTHVTAIAASGATNAAGSRYGIAPEANLVVVRAFNGNGAGSYLDVIEGLNWIVTNRKKYSIRVLNLSFSAAPQSQYWDDPLNQAVMRAWQAGIVVVTSAGNSGPVAMTVGVPGNVPYVITVGALTDNYTPYDSTDDRLASFSSVGPTHAGFVKPEVVAPGGHMVATMPNDGYIPLLKAGSMNTYQSLFTMSGTSQSAGVVSGVVALMLQSDPSLKPNDVKCRLMAAARPAVGTDGRLAYSVFQQGAGLVSAVDAVNSSATDCANQGLSVAADLAGTKHFGGPANLAADGKYYVMDMNGSKWGQPASGDGYSWSQGYAWSKGYTWSQGYAWSQGFTWSQGYSWSQGYAWSKGYAWSSGYFWSQSLPWVGAAAFSSGLTQSASINPWVDSE